MMSLSQTTGHAVRALACLSSNPASPSFIQDIAERANVPHAYLAKIVKKLNDAGIVDSKRGYRGGIWLARSPKEISLLEITEALDGKDYFACCLLGADFCSDERDCPAHKFWKQNRMKIKDELRHITLESVADFYRHRGMHQPSKPPTS